MRRWIPCLVVPMLCAGVCPAAAQTAGTQTARPYRGLFGAPPSDAAGQRVSLSIQFGAGFDDNVLVSGLGGGTGDARVLLQGARSLVGTASATLDYARRGDRLTFSAVAASGSNYHRSLASPFSSRHSASVGVGLQFSQRTRMRFSQRVFYAPYYSLGESAVTEDSTLGFAQAPDPATDTRVSRQITSSSNVMFSREMTRRLGVSLDAGYYLSGPGLDDLGLSSVGVGGRVNYSLSRGLGLRLGYGLRRVDYESSGASHYLDHNVDVGLDFSRAISLGRSTFLSFSTGLNSTRNGGVTRHALSGNVVLTREIGRSWTAHIGYQRGVRYFDVLRAPDFGDALSLGLAGLASRRLQLNFRAGASAGQVGFGQGNPAGRHFRTYYGSAGFTIGISSNVGLGTSYTYFRYNAGAEVALPTGLPRRSDRQSATVFLQVSPLFAWSGR